MSIYTGRVLAVLMLTCSFKPQTSFWTGRISRCLGVWCGRPYAGGAAGCGVGCPGAEGSAAYKTQCVNVLVTVYI